MSHFSFISIGGAGFIIGLAALLLSPSLRGKFEFVFKLPAPASQGVVKPFDSLRGFAALWVALYHVMVFSGPFGVYVPQSHIIQNGIMAVPVFVTISAFLIFRSVEKSESWADLAAYFKRRWLRIYPLYFVVLLAVLICGRFPPITALGWKRVAAEFLMLRVAGYPHYLLPVTWSLYVEEGFYLLIPAWFYFFRKRVLFGAAAAYAAFSVLFYYQPSIEADLLRYFCIGIALTQLIDCSDRVNEAIKSISLIVAIAFFVLAIEPACGVPASLHGHVVAVFIGCLLWGSANVKAVSKLLSLYPLRFLGIISYSVYLWHLLILMTALPFGYVAEPPVLLGMPYPVFASHPRLFYFLFPAAVIFYSSISYALIERPFLLLRRKAMPIGDSNGPVQKKSAGPSWKHAFVYACVVLGVLGGHAWREVTIFREARAVLHGNRGIELAAQGKLDEAVREYNLAIQMKSDNAEVHDNLGNILSQQGKNDAAIQQYNLALQANPNFTNAHYNLGIELAGKGDLDGATRHLTQAILENPKFAEAHTYLASILLRQGKLEEAIQQFRLAIQANPNSAESYTNLGIVLDMQGKPGEAATQFRQALQINPGFAPARDHLEALLKRFAPPR